MLAEKEGISTRINGTEELDRLAESIHRHPDPPFGGEGSSLNKILRSAQNDNERASLVAFAVLTLSAQLVSTQIAGIMQFQKRAITFVMQGSLFWKGYHYRETVEKTVKELSRYKAEFVKIENADLLGAAKLVV